MDVTPTIRTAREDAHTIRGEEAHAWKKRYDAYMRSPAWRTTRDAALRRARWTCMRCPTQNGLQVHHKTYERLGRELDADLEVLCLPCHEGHHVDEHQQVRNVYVAVVSDVLKRERFTCMADLMEAVKVACGRRKIHYDGRKVWRAVSLVDANRNGVIDAPKPKFQVTPNDFGRPVTKDEAVDFCRTLGMTFAGRTMAPLEKDDYARDAEKANEMRRQCARMLAGEL